MKKEILAADAAQKMIKDFARAMSLQNPVFRERFELAMRNGYSQSFAAIYAKQGEVK